MNDASFNLEYPFRIGKNFFDVDRKYNYAKYEYFINGEKVNTRFYFVRGFKYVNDNVTDMIVQNDIFGEKFYDIEIEHFLPKRFTFKENQIQNRIYQPQNINQTFELKNNLNLLKKINVRNKEYSVGFIVVSATNGENGTVEGTLKYDIDTYLMPFFVDLELNHPVSLIFNTYLRVDGEDKRIDDIVSYKKFSRIDEGFNFVSNFILTEWFNWFDIEINDNNIIFIPSFEISASFKYFPIPNDTNLNVIHLRQVDTNANKITLDLNNYSNIVDNIYCIKEYKKISINCDGEYLELDPTIINNNSTIAIKQSIIPPYNLSVYFETDFISKKYLKIQRNNQILHIDDGYTEWLKQNKNAQITGLKVQQFYDRNIMYNTLTGNAIKTGVNSIASFATGVSKMAITGNIGSTVGDFSKAMASPINNAVDAITSVSNFDENVAKQNALLDLKIMDMQNSVDKVSVGDNLGEYIQDELFFNIKFFDVIQINSIIKNHKMFGFTYCKDINNIKNHTLFDYSQGVDLVFKFKNDFSPNESERVTISKYFENGVRYWYDINNYKNFEIENSEVQDG